MSGEELSIRKFLFEHSFEPDALAMEESIKTLPTFSAEDIAMSEERAKEQGFEEGYKKAFNEIEEKISELLETIQEKMNALLELEKNSKDQIAKDAVLLASHILQKSTPQLDQMITENDIDIFASNILTTLSNNEKISLYVHADYVENLKNKLTHKNIQILAKETLQENDCFIEWANGGIERLPSKIIKKIDQHIEGFLSQLKTTYEKHNQTNDLPEDDNDENNN